MREEKLFRLGRVTIEGDMIEFEPETQLRFVADKRDAVSVGIQYVYREASEDQEEVRVRLTAQLDGQSPQTEEAHIGDHPGMDDSRRGFLRIPIRTANLPQARGRFTIEAKYGAGPWRAPREFEMEGRHEGEFVIELR